MADRHEARWVVSGRREPVERTPGPLGRLQILTPGLVGWAVVGFDGERAEEATWLIVPTSCFSTWTTWASGS